MSDSEISTTLSNVSRRDLLAAAIAAPIGMVPARNVTPSDPILRLWRERQNLHARAVALCHQWQDLETSLIRTIGFPQVTVPNADAAHGVCAMSHDEIDKALGSDTDAVEQKTALHAQLAAHQAQWDSEAERIGFHSADRRQMRAWKAEEAATRKIFATPATTLRGIEIKISVMMALCRAGSDDPDFPLPQLRSTLADIKQLPRQPGLPSA